MRKRVTIVAGLCLALSMGACGGASTGDTPSDGGQGTGGQVEEVATQAFESDQARVEYRETIDSTGNALVLFSFTNNTDKTVMVAGENVVVNGEYQITPMGGSDIGGIQPGATAQVSVVFGVSTQTPLEGVSDLETLSGDLVMRDVNHLTETVGSVHVDVTI